jgi:outer membrane protein TolC
MKPHFLAVLVCVAGWAGAEPLTLTVDQAVERSLTNNLSLQADDWAMQAKKRSNDLVWNAFIPKVTAAGAFSRLNQNIVNPLQPYRSLFSGAPASAFADYPNTWIASAQLSAQLNLSLALFDGIRHTSLDYQSSVIEHDTAKRKLVRDTKKAFYNLLLMQENIATFAAQLETARKRYEKEKRSFETGQGSEFTMLSAQVAYENMKPTLDEMQVGLKTAELGFKLLLGVDRETELTLTGSVDLNDAAVDGERLIADALARNGDLQGLRKALEIQKNLRNAKADLTYLPVLGFSYTADPTFQKDPLKNALFSDIRNDWKQVNGVFTISLGLSLDSLLPFSGTGVDLANMDNAIHQLEDTLKAASQGTEAQVAGLVMQIEKSRASVDKLGLNVDLANRAYQMAERGYQSGAYDLLQVEDAENKLRESKLAVLQEKYAYLSSLFDLEYETNQSLTVK